MKLLNIGDSIQRMGQKTIVFNNMGIKIPAINLALAVVKMELQHLNTPMIQLLSAYAIRV